MSFNGNEGGSISEAVAKQMTQAYKKMYPGTTKGVFIGKTNINSLLNRPDSMGIRVYFAQNELGENTIVMVSAKSNEDDDLGLIIDTGVPCPNRCGCSDDLNA